MAVRRPNQVKRAKPAPAFKYTEAVVRNIREDAFKAAAPPCINLYGTEGPPKGHRADCHWDQIKTKRCTCRCIAAYKKGGMTAVDKLMKGEPGW